MKVQQHHDNRNSMKLFPFLLLFSFLFVTTDVASLSQSKTNTPGSKSSSAVIQKTKKAKKKKIPPKRATTKTTKQQITPHAEKAGAVSRAKTLVPATQKVSEQSAKTQALRYTTEDDPVGKTADGKTVYEGSRGGYYYVNDKGDKTYVKDFIGAKIVGKTAGGLNIYEGPHGGRFYYNESGSKVYVKKK